MNTKNAEKNKIKHQLLSILDEDGVIHIPSSKDFFYYEIFDFLQHSVLVVNDVLNIIFTNQSLNHLCGAPYKTPSTLSELFTEEEVQKIQECLIDAHEQEIVEIPLKFNLSHLQNKKFWGYISSLQNTKQYVLTIVHSEQQHKRQEKLTEKLAIYSNMLDACVDCIKIINPEGYVLHMNKAGCEALLGCADIKEFGMEWLKLLPPDVRGVGQQAINRAKSGKNARFAGKSGEGKSVQHWDNILTPVLNDQGEVAQILCVSREVTLQKLAEAKLELMSQIDELTGLNNRRMLNQHIKNLLINANKKNAKIGLMFINLDQFKLINDTLGHDAGDYVLKTFAKRLERCQDKRTFVARLGGDEFAVVVDQLKNPDEIRKKAILILQQVEKSMNYTGKTINGSASIGCAIYPDHCTDQTEFMKAADNALNFLKVSERGGIGIFNESISIQLKETAKQLDKCRAILRDEAIYAYYQPQMNLSTGEIIGYEALLRWFDEDDVIQYPKSIFEAFQHYDLAKRIGGMIQDKVFTDIRRWQLAGHKVLPISINAAPIEFLRDDYAENLLDKLKQYDVSADLIQIEITEHVLVDRGAEYVLRALNLLKKSGVKIALDDFGTGYSSLIRLRDYPVDCLKLDASFIHSIGDDGKNFAIVKAIAELGPILSLDIIAEGIETELQRDILIKVGCQIGQGFLYSPAISSDQMYQ